MEPGLQPLYRPTLQPARPFKVFIVDDDESYLAALGFRLMKDGIRPDIKVFCYTSGEECLHYISKYNPSLIILDHLLSGKDEEGMSGLETLRRIKLLRPHIPVVILSGQKEMKVAIDLIEAGAYTYVIKDRHSLATIERIIRSFMGPKTKEKLN